MGSYTSVLLAEHFFLHKSSSNVVQTFRSSPFKITVPIHQILDGGLRRGALTELAGEGGSGNIRN